MKHTVEVMISEAEVAARIAKLGEEITARYQGSDEVVMIALLRGSCIFLADLCRQCQLPITLDFMTASSYGSGMHSTRDVRILKVDTGYTLNKVREILSLREPKSLAICTLLDKPSRREVQVPVDWIGFAIPDEFVVGCGIDYAQKYRNLPFIGKVVPQE